MEKESDLEIQTIPMIDFANMILEIHKLWPDDVGLIQQLPFNLEPALLWKFQEAENIVLCRNLDNSSAENECSCSKSTALDIKYAIDCINSILDITWEMLNTGHWSKVPIIHRQLYTAASFVKVLAILQNEPSQTDLPAPTVDKSPITGTTSNSENCQRISEALKIADMGLLLGASLPPPNGGLLHKLAKLLTSALADKSDQSSSSKRTKPSEGNLDEIQTNAKVIGSVTGQEVLHLQRPSLERFRVEHFDPRIPVVLTDCIGHWPAVTRWTDVGYLRRAAGARLVPVELGSRYTDEEWSQRLMTLSEFIDTYIDKKIVCEGNGIAYLAQHPLFDQIPELLSDIREPEYCCISDSASDDEEETDINAWFGPEGTVSPLHYDPKHNLLAQVVGSKRVVLYPPEESPCLYPHEDRLLSNTAQVDPECPNYDKFPRFKNTTPWECLLRSGEMLYIPPRWWHHVRSLEMSFSVSFWWQ